jgi:hypothetical protein
MCRRRLWFNASGGCLRLAPGAAGGAGVDAACAVTDGLVLGAAAGAQRGSGLAQWPLGGVQDKIAADQQRPPGVLGDGGRIGWFLGFLCQQAVVEGAGGAAADALGVVAAAAPVIERGHLRGRIGPAKPVVVSWGGHGHWGTAGSPATKSAWSGWRRR